MQLEEHLDRWQRQRLPRAAQYLELLSFDVDLHHVGPQAMRVAEGIERGRRHGNDAATAMWRVDERVGTARAIGRELCGADYTAHCGLDDLDALAHVIERHQTAQPGRRRWGGLEGDDLSGVADPLREEQRVGAEVRADVEHRCARRDRFTERGVLFGVPAQLPVARAQADALASRERRDEMIAWQQIEHELVQPAERRWRGPGTAAAQPLDAALDPARAAKVLAASDQIGRAACREREGVTGESTED